MMKHASVQEDRTSFIVFLQKKIIIIVQSKSLQPTRQITIDRWSKIISWYASLQENSNTCKLPFIMWCFERLTFDQLKDRISLSRLSIQCISFVIVFWGYRSCPLIVTTHWNQVSYNLWLFISGITSVSNAHLGVRHRPLPLQTVERMGNSLREQSTSHQHTGNYHLIHIDDS